jgi:protein O-GlcNAc transferase
VAIVVREMTEPTFDVAMQLYAAGRLAETEALCRQMAANQPANSDAWHLLGICVLRNGRADKAIEYFQRAISGYRENSDLAEACGNLGIALETLGKFDDAIAAHRQAIVHRPDSAEAHNNLGTALLSRGNLPEALAALQKAISLRGNFAEAFNNLGNTLRELGRVQEAVEAYRKALAIKKDFAEAGNHLGIALSILHQTDEAAAAFGRAIAVRPDFVNAMNNLCGILRETGKLDEALQLFDRALKISPNEPRIHSNRVYAVQFHPDFDAAAICRENQAWNRHAEAMRRFVKPCANDRNPSRRLRVGYISPHFRSHCQSFFTTPLLSNHDRANFEIYIYSDVIRPDGRTEKLRGMCSVWRNIVGMGDVQIAEMIRADQIDLLVDLTMHMEKNRLLVFAQKPAPVQITWLAYPGTTGLAAIDYRLTDPYLDPVGTDQFYAEKSIRLPETFWCYDPLATEPMANELPALSAGRITFGCLNNFCKVNEGTVRLWEQVLKSVPNSRLILLCPEGAHRDRLRHLPIEFVEHRPREEYLKLYHRIDIGLDTFPYNGHTTSLDSLWMGVPVVSMEGKTAVSRAAISQTSNLGMKEDWVGKTPQDFVSFAVKWANDLDRLSVLRSTLRQKMERSPLMDGPRFAKNMESIYRSVWAKYVG